MHTRRKLGIVATVAAVAAAMFAIPHSPARAEVANPRQDWLRNSVSGLFLHWGMRTSPSHSSCSGWEDAVTSGGWTADYWVQETKKLHARYLVLASFHSRLGYSRAWPSAIPGSCSTKRDFLGELIKAAHAADLKVILYMTDDPQWHNEGGTEWLNSAAYSRYKGRNVDLHSRNGFGEFSYDNWIEVMDKYPTLDGFWVDNDNAYWESHHLYELVHQRRPHMLLSNNNEDTPEMDTVSNEQKTGMPIRYDMATAIGTPFPRMIEACYKLPSSGPWWFGGSNSTVDIKLNVGRLITNAGGSIKSLMAETAMVNGKFPSNQANYNNFLNSLLTPIWESLDRVEGGGYGYGGFPGGPFGNGAYGATTVSKTNPNLYYVHVIDKPTSGNSISFQDNGYKVSRVTDLRTGATRPFTQANGTVTISGQTNWDQYDTVFRVETSGRSGIYPSSSLSASASASANGHPASAVLDGRFDTYWDSNTTLPVNVTLDQGSARKVQYLGINQREWSPTHPRDGFGGVQDSARIKAYQVQTSTNGSSWSTVKSGTLPSKRGVQMIDLGGVTTRYVRLVVTSTWSGSQAGNYVKKLRIDELFLGSSWAGGGVVEPPPPPPGATYQAEDATLNQATVSANHTGFTGTGFVDYANAAGGYVEWTVTVDAAQAGSAGLSIRYANGTTANRPMAVSVNGAAAVTVNFGGTGGWDTWQVASVNAQLKAGANTVRATATGASGGPNVDWLQVATGG